MRPGTPRGSGRGARYRSRLQTGSTDLAFAREFSERYDYPNIHSAMVYVGDEARSPGYENVFTKIAMCRRHYAECGLGETYVDSLVR